MSLLAAVAMEWWWLSPAVLAGALTYAAVRRGRRVLRDARAALAKPAEPDPAEVHRWLEIELGDVEWLWPPRGSGA